MRIYLAYGCRMCSPPAVDRAFNVAGAGLVVTGMVHSGAIATGETVLVSPSGESARIRGLRVQDQAAETARQGDRCAINLAGPGKDDIDTTSTASDIQNSFPTRFSFQQISDIRIKCLTQPFFFQSSTSIKKGLLGLPRRPW